ncbi:unnamed protein product [Lactuca virosa]|uniref:Uncharacterized protein n=1 Tax=Lactuca virosa TaxID=75947 RepID=A0AAU9P476_9ASTR|nr:unnamed protein product [Lactuca virosa]
MYTDRLPSQIELNHNLESLPWKIQTTSSSISPDAKALTISHFFWAVQELYNQPRLTLREQLSRLQG